MFALQTVTTVERQVIGWFDIDDAARFKGNFPISIITDERAAYYVFPPFDHAGLKVRYGPAHTSHKLIY